MKESFIMPPYTLHIVYSAFAAMRIRHFTFPVLTLTTFHVVLIEIPKTVFAAVTAAALDVRFAMTTSGLVAPNDVGSRVANAIVERPDRIAVASWKGSIGSLWGSTSLILIGTENCLVISHLESTWFSKLNFVILKNSKEKPYYLLYPKEEYYIKFIQFLTHFLTRKTCQSPPLISIPIIKKWIFQ